MKRSEIIERALASAQAEGIPIEDDVLLQALIDTPVPDASAELDALRAQVAALQATQRQIEASAYAAQLLQERRIVPSEQAQVAALYVQAASDDASMPLQNGSRVAVLQSAYAARPPHRLTEELVPDGRLVALANSGDQEDTATRKRKLLAMTPLGRAVLKEDRHAR